jgi:hypothetical protein
MWMTQAVSTLDLTRPAPELLHWLPTAYDVDWLQDFAKKRRQGMRRDLGTVRIVSCPTNREFKATEALIAAVMDLAAEGLPVELVLVEGKPWYEALTIKATADIVFDQLAWGYGCNAVEAWGMGIPVVSGADDWTLERMHQEFGKRGLPFVEASQATLVDVLRKLVESKDLRAKWGAKGLAHVRKYHDERPALARLAELYHRTIQTYVTKGNRLGKPIKPVLFRSRGARSLRVDDQVVVFAGGQHVSTDPFVIARLRYFAKSRPSWGIEEVA